MKEKSQRLNGKDLLNIGIFTAVYFVVNLAVAFSLGLIPIASTLIPFISSVILGIPMVLYFSRIKKFGMILIVVFVYGLFLVMAGVGIYTLILGTVCALIAEFMLKAGKYSSIKLTILAFAIVSVGANGNVLQMLFASTEYLTSTAATYGADYLEAIANYYSLWWYLPVIFASAFVGGLLGGLLGKSVLKKHFKKSGLV